MPIKRPSHYYITEQVINGQADELIKLCEMATVRSTCTYLNQTEVDLLPLPLAML